jgi:hypothetical protein
MKPSITTKLLAITEADDRVPLLATLEAAKGRPQLQEQELSPNASPLP